MVKKTAYNIKSLTLSQEEIQSKMIPNLENDFRRDFSEKVYIYKNRYSWVFFEIIE